MIEGVFQCFAMFCFGFFCKNFKKTQRCAHFKPDATHDKNEDKSYFYMIFLTSFCFKWWHLTADWQRNSLINLSEQELIKKWSGESSVANFHQLGLSTHHTIQCKPRMCQSFFHLSWTEQYRQDVSQHMEPASRVLLSNWREEECSAVEKFFVLLCSWFLQLLHVDEMEHNRILLHLYIWEV